MNYNKKKKVLKNVKYTPHEINGKHEAMEAEIDGILFSTTFDMQKRLKCQSFAVDAYRDEMKRFKRKFSACLILLSCVVVAVAIIALL